MNRTQEARRKEAMNQKYQKIENLRALIAEWEPFESNSQSNILYVRGLRRKLQRKETELQNMGGQIQC